MLSWTKSVVISLAHIFSLSPLCCDLRQWNKQTHLQKTGVYREKSTFGVWCWCDWLWCSRFLIRVRLAPCLNVYSALARRAAKPKTHYGLLERAEKDLSSFSLCASFSLFSCRGLFCARADGRVTQLGVTTNLMAPVRKDTEPVALFASLSLHWINSIVAQWLCASWTKSICVFCLSWLRTQNFSLHFRRENCELE